jgi:hypothetical protein
MRLWEPFDIVLVLEKHRLLEQDEVENLLELLEQSETDYEPLLKARVQRAYCDYHNVSHTQEGAILWRPIGSENSISR